MSLRSHPTRFAARSSRSSPPQPTPAPRISRAPLRDGNAARTVGRAPVRERQVTTDLDAASDERVASGFAEGGAAEVQVLPDARVAEGNLSLCGEPESCQQAEADGQVEGVHGPAPAASDDGPVQPDDPADLRAG